MTMTSSSSLPIAEGETRNQDDFDIGFHGDLIEITKSTQEEVGCGKLCHIIAYQFWIFILILISFLPP